MNKFVKFLWSLVLLLTIGLLYLLSPSVYVHDWLVDFVEQKTFEVSTK